MQSRFTRRLATAVALAALLGVGAARAEDQLLAGSKLVLRKGSSGEHLVLLARDGVVAPLPGGSEDPTLRGAVVEISNPRTGERARFETPARAWTLNATGTVFRFRNALAKGRGSEVRALVIRHQRRLEISTRALGITLDEESQRVLSVVVTSGTRRYCLLFGGRVGKDRPGRFAARNAPAPLACPAPVVVSSTTTTSRPPGTGPTTSTSVGAGSTTSTSSTTPSTATLPVGSSTSTTRPTTTTTRPPTTTSRPPAATTSTSTTVRPPTTSSTSTSSTTTRPAPPPTTSSTASPPPPPTTTSTSSPPPTTSTSVQLPPSTSTSLPPPTTTSTQAPTPTTSTTLQPCGRRGLSCAGTCPPGLRCGGFILCSCRP